MLLKNRRLLILCLAIFIVFAPGFNLTTQATPGSDWPAWGYDLGNHRYNPNEKTITPANVGNLQLKWAFAFQDTNIASTSPTVIGDTVYVGSWNGNLYALDAATGKQRWAFFTGVTGKTGAIRAAVVVAHDLVMFGDQLGRFFAVNASNGTLAWVQQDMDKHPLAQITGSPVVYADRVYVPMASREENASTDPAYPCCTFRGSLIALNISDGSIAWQFYAIDDVAHPTTTSSAGTQLSGPSGVGLWSSPSIDPDEGLIYVSTGNNYSEPTTSYSDAILALNLRNGTLRWAKQVTPNDWANEACRPAVPGPNCEGDHGGDLDFGASPVLYTIQTANGPRKLVAAEQKSGILYALDALTGEEVWQRKVGEDVSYAWGMSYDGKNFYLGDTSFELNGSVFALNPASGDIVWRAPAMPCKPGPDKTRFSCWSGYMAAAISTPGLVWIGSMDGVLHSLDSANGKVLWSYDTAQKDVPTVNGVAGHGGSIGPANATVANGQVYVTSGYATWIDSMMDGNVLYAFGLPTQEDF